jgi:hypothetical protein
VRSLSLFGGVATVASVRLEVAGGRPRAGVLDLRVHGSSVPLAQGGRFTLGPWGYLLAPGRTAGGRLLNTAAPTSFGDRGSVLSIHLVASHAGLPAGTVVSVGFVGFEPPRPPAPETSPVPVPPRRAAPNSRGRARSAQPALQPPRIRLPGVIRGSGRQRHVERGPLTVTPPLGGGPYLLPVAGSVAFGDSYGGPRGDVSGGWHHGDDLFAPLGTPVVAVADGTLNRVGWERLGGWRLWVRDRAGDEFYYAHLSGYTDAALAGGKVTAGEVIGFVGNTGDAFTTMPHLHFEIHPRPLLHLHYDGAVDPTSYLDEWRREGRVVAPLPVHPRLPSAAAARAEAEQNFRELLAARGVEPRRQPGRPTPKMPPTAQLPLPLVRAAAPVPRTPNTSGLVWPLLAGVAAAAGAAALYLRARRRRAVAAEP